MITIWKSNGNGWELVEELQDDLALAQRIADLRSDGNQYRAEKSDGGFSSILEN